MRTASSKRRTHDECIAGYTATDWKRFLLNRRAVEGAMRSVAKTYFGFVMSGETDGDNFLRQVFGGGNYVDP